MLSLSPRYDLIKFHLPKTFIPKEIEEKYTKLLSKDSYTLKSSIDYLNESIQSVTMPGISGLTIVQQQHGSNSIIPGTGINTSINTEPMHEITYLSSGNPLEKMDKEFKVSFRLNQGLYNYFMLYETAFYYACRKERWQPEYVMYIEILNEDGSVISKVKFIDVYMDGIDGLEFNYNKIEREFFTFDVVFKFNNIDFEHFLNETTTTTNTNIQ
jgi:hypothetical protein